MLGRGGKGAEVRHTNNFPHRPEMPIFCFK